MALSSAHDILTRTAWEGAALADVVRAALAPFDGGNQRVRFEGPTITVAPNVAVALSMAFHELATNAAKYGALSNADGCVTVTWTLAEGATTTIIHWQESSGPSVTSPTRRGFGSRLIERGLAYELDSEVTLEFPPAGVECRILLPLPPKIGSTPNE